MHLAILHVPIHCLLCPLIMRVSDNLETMQSWICSWPDKKNSGCPNVNNKENDFKVVMEELCNTGWGVTKKRPVKCTNHTLTVPVEKCDYTMDSYYILKRFDIIVLLLYLLYPFIDVWHSCTLKSKPDLAISHKGAGGPTYLNGKLRLSRSSLTKHLLLLSTTGPELHMMKN